MRVCGQFERLNMRSSEENVHRLDLNYLYNIYTQELFSATVRDYLRHSCSD